MKKLIKLLIIVAIIFGSYKLLSKSPTTTSPSDNVKLSEETDYIFYYGNTCPHCLAVEEFIDDNQVDQKLNIISKEIYDNKDNREEMLEVANQYCSQLVDPTSGGVGVPFFFDVKNETCLLGDTPIIDFLKEKIE